MSAAASVKGVVTGKGFGTPNNTGGGVGNSTSRRVLVLSQKGDWTACDSTLKVLEKESSEAGIRLPLATVADNVSPAFYFRIVYQTESLKSSICLTLDDSNCNISHVGIRHGGNRSIKP